MTKKAHGLCTCPHAHEVAAQPANPPAQCGRAALLRDLFGKQKGAIRDLTLHAVTVGNRVVGVEGKVVDLGDQIRTISTRPAAPPAAGASIVQAAPRDARFDGI